MSRKQGFAWPKSIAKLGGRLGRLLEGPTSHVEVNASAATWTTRHPGRPIVLEVAENAILASRLTLPRLSSRQILSAATLMLESETPFKASELLIAVRARPEIAVDQRLTYDVFALPKSIVDDSLKALRIASDRVAAVVGTDGPSSAGNKVWFPWGTKRQRVFGAAAAAVPLLLVTAGLGWSAASLNASWNATLEGLTAEQDRVLAETRRLQSQITDAQTRAAEQAEVKALLARPSVYVGLNDLKALLPSDTLLSALNIQKDELRVTIQTKGVLEAVAELNAAGRWSVTVEGGIAADPTSWGEIATLKLGAK